MITVLILEDEEYTRRYLAKLVTEHEGVGEVFAVSSGKEALATAEAKKPDVALLDIELGKGEYSNGIQVADDISRISPQTRYVFVTGHSNYALDSFVVHPYDYLLKPVDRQKLRETISSLVALQQAPAQDNGGIITVRTRDGKEFVPIKEIIFVAKAGKKISIHTKDKVYQLWDTLQEFEKLLPHDYFLRLHKSFIVNVNKITGIKDIGDRSYAVSFHDTDKVALMSRNYYNEHRERLGL